MLQYDGYNNKRYLEVDKYFFLCVSWNNQNRCLRGGPPRWAVKDAMGRLAGRRQREVLSSRRGATLALVWGWRTVLSGPAACAVHRRGQANTGNRPAL